MRPWLNAVAAMACACALSISAADAKPRQQNQASAGVSQFCGDRYGPCAGESAESFVGSRADSPTVMLSHPAGCPATAFCGCGAAVRVFGHSVRDLWPSCNWFDGRFPAAQPAPGMVAGGCGHVFVLESHVAGSDWMVSDYNSGKHLSRRHIRSIAGLKVVDPHGSRMASR